MKLIQKIKQHFCRHIDDPNGRNHRVPFLGFVFKCPKCQGYVVYFKNWDGYYDISEKQYISYTEEGDKLWARWNCEVEDDGK